MIVLGSNNYTYSGRKRKTTRRVTKVKPVWRPLSATDTYRRDTVDYPSADPAPKVSYGSGREDFRKEISSKYTIAPAYNKGAYQVIPKDAVKDIGR